MVQLALNKLALFFFLILTEKKKKIQAHEQLSQLSYVCMKNEAPRIRNTYFPNSIGWPPCPSDMQQTV